MQVFYQNTLKQTQTFNTKCWQECGETGFHVAMLSVTAILENVWQFLLNPSICTPEHLSRK